MYDAHYLLYLHCLTLGTYNKLQLTYFQRCIMSMFRGSPQSLIFQLLLQSSIHSLFQNKIYFPHKHHFSIFFDIRFFLKATLEHLLRPCIANYSMYKNEEKIKMRIFNFWAAGWEWKPQTLGKSRIFSFLGLGAIVTAKMGKEGDQVWTLFFVS